METLGIKRKQREDIVNTWAMETHCDNESIAKWRIWNRCQRQHSGYLQVVQSVSMLEILHYNGFWDAQHSETRERGGGGQWGQLAPQFWSCGGAAPQLWTVNIVNFYFCLFLHVNLGLPKIVGQIREFLVLCRGYLGPQETFAPHPQLQSSSRAPGSIHFI